MLTLTRPLIALDLETTGTNPRRDRIVQIGIVKLHPDGREKEWESLVNPTIPIPKEISDIHGITDEMVADELPFKQIGKMVYPTIKDCDICGYNVEFDLRFLKIEFRMIGIDWVPGKEIDSFKIFQKKERRNLEAAVEFYLNKKHEGAHTALADARASLQILHAQIKMYDLPVTIPELYELQNEIPKGYLDKDRKIILLNDQPALNFGKMKGVLLKNVGNNYLNWILGSDFSDQVKEVVRKFV